MSFDSIRVLGQFGMLGGMSMIRRLTLGIGAALLVGGWGMMRYGVDGDIARETALSPRGASIVIVAGMALGAGLIGFAVLRPTNHKDE